ncbi:MAG TPA: hydroxymethylbilane synthase [Chloroflexi bacterium]|nr:hydroxymethylbilane synthase [Chloroflexota bacterium]
MTKIIFATRPSKLARWQTNYVIQLLQQAVPGLVCEVIVITTRGDRELDKPLPEIGGKGLFTQELEAELLSGHVCAAVHSLKDLPVENTAGLTVGGIPVRVDPRDVLVCTRSCSLEELPSGAVIGTSSLRRQAQVLRHRPDLKIESIRGNVDTRIRKVEEGQYDAAVMAGAGITRLGLDKHIATWLPLSIMLPAPGQGALGIQCRADDKTTLAILKKISDIDTTKSVRAERAFLLALGGGCSIPVGAYAEIKEGVIVMQGLVAATDGTQVIREDGQGEEPDALSKQLAKQALARGGGEVLHG